MPESKTRVKEEVRGVVKLALSSSTYSEFFVNTPFEYPPELPRIHSEQISYWEISHYVPRQYVVTPVVELFLNEELERKYSIFTKRSKLSDFLEKKIHHYRMRWEKIPMNEISREHILHYDSYHLANEFTTKLSLETRNILRLFSGPGSLL